MTGLTLRNSPDGSTMQCDVGRGFLYLILLVLFMFWEL